MTTADALRTFSAVQAELATAACMILDLADAQGDDMENDETEIAPCQCGRAYGERCDSSAPATTQVDWMPLYLRSSHEAAGNSGAYPHNGAHRLAVTARCAAALVRDSDGWASIIE